MVELVGQAAIVARNDIGTNFTIGKSFLQGIQASRRHFCLSQLQQLELRHRFNNGQAAIGDVAT